MTQTSPSKSTLNCGLTLSNISNRTLFLTNPFTTLIQHPLCLQNIFWYHRFVVLKLRSKIYSGWYASGFRVCYFITSHYMTRVLYCLFFSVSAVRFQWRGFLNLHFVCENIEIYEMVVFFHPLLSQMNPILEGYLSEWQVNRKTARFTYWLDGLLQLKIILYLAPKNCCFIIYCGWLILETEPRNIYSFWLQISFYDWFNRFSIIVCIIEYKHRSPWS